MDHVNICKLCMLFAGVLGERMPPEIHNRILLGSGNVWAGEYLSVVSGLRPRLFGIFNMNAKRFSCCRLGDRGLILVCTK